MCRDADAARASAENAIACCHDLQGQISALSDKLHQLAALLPEPENYTSGYIWTKTAGWARADAWENYGEDL